MSERIKHSDIKLISRSPPPPSQPPPSPDPPPPAAQALQLTFLVDPLSKVRLACAAYVMSEKAVYNHPQPHPATSRHPSCSESELAAAFVISHPKPLTKQSDSLYDRRTRRCKRCGAPWSVYPPSPRAPRPCARWASTGGWPCACVGSRSTTGSGWAWSSPSATRPPPSPECPPSASSTCR